MLSLIAALPLMTGGAPPFAPPQDPEPAPPIQLDGNRYVIHFPKAREGVEAMTLARFVEACQEATGINFTYSPETENYLESTKVRLLGTKSVPKDEFYSFFQIILVVYEFVCTEVGAGELAVIEIESMAVGGVGKLRANSAFVDEEDLEQYAAQPATLITTVIQLPHTDVTRLANSIRPLISDPHTQQMLPAGASGAMVITGFGSNVVALARMLRIVDEASQVEPITPTFDVIPLEYADADEVAAMVEELLTIQRTAQRPTQGPTGPQAARVETKVVVNTRDNSLLVMGMPEDLPQIKELIARLDVNVVERQRAYHVYRLQNVKAEEIAEVLNAFLQDSATVEGSGPGRGGGGGGSTRESVVVPDKETNALLIAAGRSRYEEILALVEQLDRRQDQVLIETALIELSGRDFLDIGVELGLANLPGADARTGFGVTDFGLSMLDDVDLDGVLDTRVPLQATGITAGILDGESFNLPLLFRFLEERRDSNVLNVPSVLVNNNGRAVVESLQGQPTTSVTSVGVGQSQSAFADYVEAGVTLTISPSISASRYLRLEIELNVSNFLGAAVGAIPPPRVVRNLYTTVNVPDGDTMVIGGIIVDNRTDTRQQVPLLGDIPILGALFGRDTSTLDRTALYFFVTPHIMRDADFADLAEYSYERKIDATRNMGLDRMRMIDPDFGGPAGGVDLGGFELPLYSKPAPGEVRGSDVGLDALAIHDRLRAARGAPEPGPDENR